MDIDKGLETLLKGKLLTEDETSNFCNSLKEILILEPNVIQTKGPCHVVGDIHGQFYDLLVMMRMALGINSDAPPVNLGSHQFIFLGDYVDRGYNSVETFEYLMLIKLKYPSQITLVRGNHESRQISMSYGFHEEILKKYGSSDLWELFTEIFDFLPLGALINEDTLSIHGGLSQSINSVEELQAINRNMEIPFSGPMTDIMWSDPDYVDGFKKSARGVGYLFGENDTRRFLNYNGLKLIVRSHQLVMEGYQLWFSPLDPILITVWSAPNYCYRCGNVATFLNISETGKREFVKFTNDAKSSKELPFKSMVPYFM